MRLNVLSRALITNTMEMLLIWGTFHFICFMLWNYQPPPFLQTQQASIIHKTRPLFTEYQGHPSLRAIFLCNYSVFTLCMVEKHSSLSNFLIQSFWEIFGSFFSYVNTGYWSFCVQNEKSKRSEKRDEIELEIFSLGDSLAEFMSQ